MGVLAEVYDFLVYNKTIYKENIFTNNRNEVCKKVFLVDADDIAYDILIVNDEVKQITEL